MTRIKTDLIRIYPCNPWLSIYPALARDVNEHLGARFNLQLFAAVCAQRSGATGPADDQANRRALAATGNTAHDRADRRADSRALHRLLGPASRFDAAFVISTPGILAVNSRDVPVQHSSFSVAHFDLIE